MIILVLHSDQQASWFTPVPTGHCGYLTKITGVTTHCWGETASSITPMNPRSLQQFGLMWWRRFGGWLNLPHLGNMKEIYHDLSLPRQFLSGQGPGRGPTLQVFFLASGLDMTFPHPQARCYCSIDPEAWGFTSIATSFGKELQDRLLFPIEQWF